MNPEVIFVFVVLIVINSLFNKNKVQKKQQQRRNQQNQQNQRPQSSGPSEKREQQTKTDSRRETSESGKQKSRSLLEEVLEQYNVSEKQVPSRGEQKKPEETPEKVKKASGDEGHYTDYSDRDQPKKSRKKKEMKAYSKPRKKGVETGELSGDFFEKTSVEKSEIGVEGFNELLEFDQKSLVRGIVMSEVLQKPKSMRKKKVG